MIGWLIVIFILFMIFVVIPLGIVAWLLSRRYNRQERQIRNEAEAHRKILEGTYDRIWQNIKLRAGIPENRRRDFNSIYPDLLDRSIDNEKFINWILDCNADFDPAEYVPLLESIAFDREKFVNHQLRMMALIKEHRLLLGTIPSKWLIKDKTAIFYIPVDTEYTRWGRSL